MTGVSRWAREIVAQRVGILAGLATILGLLVGLNVIGLDLSAQVTGVVVVVLNVLAAVTGILWARTGVTPADVALAPTSSGGVPLVELDLPPAGQHVETQLPPAPPLVT